MTTFNQRYKADSIQPGDDVIEYSSFGADINFVALFGQPVRRIDIVTAGSGAIVLKTRGGQAAASPTNRTLTGLLDGDKIGPVQVLAIIASGTSVTKVRVYI